MRYRATALIPPAPGDRIKTTSGMRVTRGVFRAGRADAIQSRLSEKRLATAAPGREDIRLTCSAAYRLSKFFTPPRPPIPRHEEAFRSAPHAWLPCRPGPWLPAL